MFCVAGEIFETYNGTLLRYPRTLLGNKRKLDEYYCSQRGHYFFNRNRRCFEAILFFYQSKGCLKRPYDISMTMFENECQYFEIPQKVIDKMKWDEGILPSLFCERYHGSNEDTFRMRVWTILNDPNSSNLAWTYGLFSLLVTLFSISTAILETLPELSAHRAFWFYADLALNIWFLFEIIFRVSFALDKLKFLKEIFTMIDIAVVVPYFLYLVTNSKKPFIVRFFKSLKFMRAVRLFRFTKHSRRLRVVLKIISSCRHNFQVFLLCSLMMSILGATFIYIIERIASDNTTVTSIPMGMWWATQTLCNVGYGDIIPCTVYGKIFAGLFMGFGTTLLLIPVLRIVSKFTTIYLKNVYSIKSVYEKYVTMSQIPRQSMSYKEIVTRDLLWQNYE